MVRYILLICIIFISHFPTRYFSPDLLNNSCIMIPDFPDQCLFFVAGGTYEESSYNCHNTYDGQLACCDTFTKFVRNYITGISTLYWIGLRSEKMRENSAKTYLWSNNQIFPRPEAEKLLDIASRSRNVGLQFPADDEDEEDVDDDDANDQNDRSCVAVLANRLYTMSCDTYLSLALCQRLRRRQCHTWEVIEGHCFYNNRGICVRRILSRYHEGDDNGAKCVEQIKLKKYRFEACNQPLIACKTSCHPGAWLSWSPCRVNCSREKWALGDVERPQRAAPQPYACFAKCNQTGVMFRERVSYMIGSGALHCPVEYQRSNCTGHCGVSDAHLYPPPFVPEYGVTKSGKVLVNTDDWGGILPSGDVKNVMKMRYRLALIIFLVATGVGIALVVVLALYRRHGWKTSWLATKSTSSRDILPTNQRDAWYKVHPKACQCPKSASISCDGINRKQLKKIVFTKKKKNRTFPVHKKSDSKSSKKLKN